MLVGAGRGPVKHAEGRMHRSRHPVYGENERIYIVHERSVAYTGVEFYPAVGRCRLQQTFRRPVT